MAGVGAILCALAYLALLIHFCSAAGCAASVHTTPAGATARRTTTFPDGRIVQDEANANTAAGAASGDAAAHMDQKNGPPTAAVDQTGAHANGGENQSDLSAKMSGLSVFWWAAILSGAGGVAMLALKQIRLGLWALGFAAMFALCAYSPLFLLGVAAVGMLSLYHTGRSFEGLRAVIAAAGGTGGEVWKQIRAKMTTEKYADFGDHAAVNAAEKAET